MRRRSTPFDWLVVGLGNPGKEYARTRHNVGEEVVVELARRRGDTLRGGRDNSLVAESRIGDERWVLAFPLTYMNESGMAVRSLVRRYGIEDAAHLVVVHDELDLPPSKLQIKVGGGLAGHNGLRSIAQHLGTQDFLRVRIGIGKPPGGKERGGDHVLSPPVDSSARAVRRRRAGGRRRRRADRDRGRRRRHAHVQPPRCLSLTATIRF